MKSRFRILGRTRLLVGNHFDDQWGHPRLRGILAVLLLHPRRSIPIDVLIDWVWPDGKEPQDPATLYTYKRRIVEALGRMAAPPKIISDRGAYRIEVDREDVDFFAFQAAVKRARTLVHDGEHEAAVQILTPALDLWTDFPLADLHGERARNWRQWAQSEHLIPAHDVLCQALSALGRHGEVLHRLDDLPLDQQQSLLLVKRRLEALHGSARSKEAQAHYLDARKRLKADFDDDAADALKHFYDNLTATTPQPTSPPAGDPPTTVEHTPHLLPHDISDFTGREQLLTQLDAMATTTTGEPGPGIVLLTGPPGVGKTALAVHWAHRVSNRFPGGRLYIDMCGFADGPKIEPADVVDRFLTAFDFPVERIPSSAGRAAKLRNLLTGRRVLAVLDNVASANHVIPLLDCLSSCLLVITSRRRLAGLTRRGAVGLQVQPLDYGEAKVWLTSRIGRRATTEPDAIAELTAICAGTPLALRGVADHVVIRPHVRLSEFVDELRDTHALLGLGDDGDGDGNIRTVFSWSYRALSANEQQLFRLLGLHPGPDLDLNTASVLAGRDIVSTKRDLDTLVNAHMLTQPESRIRYRLHDLARKYAAESAAAEQHRAERAAAEARLLSFYLHSANNADATVFPYRPRDEIPPVAPGVTPRNFPDDEAAMNWCVRERANLNAIVRYAVTHGFHEYAMRLTNSSGEILQRVGHHEDVISCLIMAIQSARQVGDIETEGDLLGNLAFIYLNQRHLNAAEKCLRAADGLYRTIGYRTGTAMVMHHRARLYVERGNFNSAIQLYLNALTILRQEEATTLEVITMYRLSEAYRRAGNLDAAMTACRDGLWRAERVGDHYGQALCLGELAFIYYEQGDVTSAKSYCGRALSIQERLRDLAQVGRSYNLLATIHRDEGDLDEAERCARQGLVYCRSARIVKEEGIAYQTLGYVLHEQARSDEAAEAWANALAIMDDLGDPLAGSVRAQLAETVAIPPRVPASRTEPLMPEHRRATEPLFD